MYNLIYNSIGMTLLYLYLDRVLAAPHHIPAHPLFFLSPLRSLFFKGDDRDDHLMATSSVDGCECILKVRGLRKEYRTSNRVVALFKRLFGRGQAGSNRTVLVAVDNLDLDLQNNQLFSLLGQVIFSFIYLDRKENTKEKLLSEWSRKDDHNLASHWFSIDNRWHSLVQRKVYMPRVVPTFYWYTLGFF